MPMALARMHSSPLVSVSGVTEASKSVLVSAFRLHLLGLNARVMATRLGAEARGFGVLSAEWVALGRRLDQQMRALEGLSEQVVQAISRDQLRKQRWRLLSACEAGALVSLSGAVREQADDLTVARTALRLAVSEALRACTFGLVIARSAKIEAAWSSGARDALGALATEFESQLGEILPPLRTLVALERRALS
jgi:hypothetical protein